MWIETSNVLFIRNFFGRPNDRNKQQQKNFGFRYNFLKSYSSLLKFKCRPKRDIFCWEISFSLWCLSFIRISDIHTWIGRCYLKKCTVVKKCTIVNFTSLGLCKIKLWRVLCKMKCTTWDTCWNIQIIITVDIWKGKLMVENTAGLKEKRMAQFSQRSKNNKL